MKGCIQYCDTLPERMMPCQTDCGSCHKYSAPPQAALGIIPLAEPQADVPSGRQLIAFLNHAVIKLCKAEQCTPSVSFLSKHHVRAIQMTSPCKFEILECATLVKSVVAQDASDAYCKTSLSLWNMKLRRPTGGQVNPAQIEVL